jgi:excisionase family DNA binding protein
MRSIVPWGAPMVGNYVTVGEAASKLGLSKGTVWKRIYRRSIPYHKIGSHLALVRFEDVAFTRAQEDKRKTVCS